MELRWGVFSDRCGAHDLLCGVFWLGFVVGVFFLPYPSQHPREPVGDVGKGSLQALAVASCVRVRGCRDRATLSRERPCISTVGFCVD